MKIKASGEKGAIGTFLLVVLLLIILVFMANFLTEFSPENIDNLADDTLGDDSVDEVLFETISQGVYSAYEESGAVIITNSDDFRNLWKGIETRQEPEIDFENDIVLAVFLGEKPTGGYRIVIDKIISLGDSLEVSAKEVYPGGDCIVTESLTSPYHIIKTNKSSGSISFFSTKTVEDC